MVLKFFVNHGQLFAVMAQMFIKRPLIYDFTKFSSTHTISGLIYLSAQKKSDLLHCNSSNFLKALSIFFITSGATHRDDIGI